MPKKVEKPSSLEGLAWIQNLPDGGGSWGKGIIETVTGFEVEAMEADEEIGKLNEQIKTLREKSNKRRLMAQQAAGRAEREAKNLFTEAQIAQAKPAPAPDPTPAS